MAHWNYRILAKKVGVEVEFALYEVHYDENNKPVAYTENSVSAVGFKSEGDPVESIKWQLDAMKIASEKPVLDYDHFPNEYIKYSREKKLKVIESK
jgi:hypothetical protein